MSVLPSLLVSMTRLTTLFEYNEYKDADEVAMTKARKQKGFFVDY